MVNVCYVWILTFFNPFTRDRFRTMVNVMGDALATGIMAHICRKDFIKEGEEVQIWLCVFILSLWYLAAMLVMLLDRDQSYLIFFFSFL